MPTFLEHSSHHVVKALVPSEPVMGKTGALAALANAGYKLLIHDFDNNLDVMKAYLTEEGKNNVFYHSYNITEPKEAQRFGTNLRKWGDSIPDTKDLDDKYIIVIDTLSSLAELVRRFVLKTKNIDPKTMAFSMEFWGEMQRVMLEPILYLAGPEVPCHVIVNTHIQEAPDSKGISKEYPKTVGRALSREITRYFPNIWRIERDRDGNRYISTVSTRTMELRVSRPDKVQPKEPLDYVALFNKLLGD